MRKQLMTLVTCPAAVYQPDDQGPIAPSAVAISGQIDLPDGSKGDFAVPRALRTEEVPAIAQQFATGARNALAAGFDGVEVSARPPCGPPAIAESFGAVCKLRSVTHASGAECMAPALHLSASHGLLQIHGAHGYLLEEFIKTSTNKRTDKYGAHVLCACVGRRWCLRGP